MDQIYIPKKRSSFLIGEYVIVKPIIENEQNKEKLTKQKIKLNFYQVKQIEPIKLKIIQDLIENIDKKEIENIIITGSFLEKAFNFNDIDIILLTENKPLKNQIKRISEELEEKTGIKIHVLIMTNKELINGFSTDPLYQNMLSQYISTKRIIINPEQKIIPELLDLALIKSKILIDNFLSLNGKEKYYLTLNLIAINLFIKDIRVTKQKIREEIKKIFNIEEESIKNNILGKIFLKEYKNLYDQTFKSILNLVEKNKKNGPK